MKASVGRVIPMVRSSATLHLLCGKIAAGKSTLAARLGEAENTIVLSEDRWLASLYPVEIKTLADYAQRSTRLREVLAPHIVSLLRLGLSVVLDFHANTVVARLWMRALFEEGDAYHQLHFLDVPDDVCRARLHARNVAGGHDYAVDDSEFDFVTGFFVPPHASEGFNVVHYDGR
jgi:predicted kinase